MAIFAIDFDGTLCENNYPWIGRPKEEVITFVKALRKAGDKLILWTCRSGRDLTLALNWCKIQGLEFDAVNQNLKENIKKYGNDTRKIYADYYLDDRNLSVFEITDKTKPELLKEMYQHIEIVKSEKTPENTKFATVIMLEVYRNILYRLKFITKQQAKEVIEVIQTHFIDVFEAQE